MNDLFTIYHLSDDKQRWQRGQSFVDFDEARANAPDYGKASAILYGHQGECIDHKTVLIELHVLRVVLAAENVAAMQQAIKDKAMKKRP
jgi:hypothetical protein